MEEEKDAFYVVRKGDIIGVYKTLRDCQAQAGSSVCDPAVTVYKGYGLTKEAEDYLASHGLNNAAYSVGAGDVKDDTFGKLVPCPFQQPALSTGKASVKDSPPKRLPGVLQSDDVNAAGPEVAMQARFNLPQGPMGKFYDGYCILKFDGASKGNPGPAGAGAVLRFEDGCTVVRLCEGVGIATNNVAEYRALLLGLKYALKTGVKKIRVQGDSKLVCMQVQGLWKINNQNLAVLCKEARDLKDRFMSFQINHVLREFNSEADAQANQAINFRDGQLQESWDTK